MFKRIFFFEVFIVRYFFEVIIVGNMKFEIFFIIDILKVMFRRGI